ncbi:glutamine phosphoribosylpyrophosphate amidotransferase [Thaumarchaeota archaeon SCGC AB-539-E09]|nr:glutamine phosphoribosylpyrophosphate amidotransferase [Thaumarchaeota archaeon SCGC AB-539-E09]
MQGIVGVYSKENAVRKAINMLYGVQHRGQESSGLTAAGDNSIRTWNDVGLVSKVFNEQFNPFIHPNDYLVICSASGESTGHGKLPPINFVSENYTISLAIDGFVPNKSGLMSEEIFGPTLISKLSHAPLEKALTETMHEMGSAYYSLVLAVHNSETEQSELIVMRDRCGIRPLYIGYNDDELFAASESAPFDLLESMGETLNVRRDVNPGTIIRRNEEGMSEIQVLDPTPAHCAFEWVYFGRPDSVIEGRTVHMVRKKLGHSLVNTHAMKDKTNDAVLIPVPDSGRSVCTGVAEALAVTADEGVIKNAYLGRTYLINDPEYRKIASDLKHNIIKETIKGKKVIITDDSIVRGTVSESVAKNLLKAGATEVEFLVSYAPIYYPCFSDPPDKPLTAAPYKGKSLEEIGDLVASRLPSINKVRYNSPKNIIDAIGLPSSTICTMCIDGKNPLKKK